jgi:hypothetical protein
VLTPTTEEITMATRDDGMLMVQVLRWGTEMGLDDALARIFEEGFDAKSQADDPSVRTVLAFGETVGALIKHGLLDRDLARDIFWFDGMWARVGHHALAARAQEGEPTLYEHFEAMVTKADA